MSEPTLRDFLQFNIDWLHNAVKTVKAGGDLQPQLSFFDRDGNLGVMPLTLDNKDREMQMARALLKARGATMYALFSAAWSVRLDEAWMEPGDAERLKAIMDEHGTGHPAVKPLREEIYFVSVGDKNGTLYVSFSVERDYKGKIRQLHRQPDLPPHAMSEGRMVDLLAEARH